MAATQHLQLRPKSDLALLYAITQHLIAEDYVDQDFVRSHTAGFERLREQQRFEEMEVVAKRAHELAPNEPVATGTPSCPSSRATASTSGSATSPPAAAVHDGRRLRRTSP